MLGGLDAELLGEQSAAQLVLPQGFDGIALGEVEPDQRSMGALAERLADKRRESELQSIAEPALGREAVAQCLKGTQTKLAEPLTLEERPVVVPVGQHVDRQAVRRKSLGIANGPFEQPLREHFRVVEVDNHPAVDGELGRAHVEQIVGRSLHTPEGRPEIRLGASVGGLGPERARDEAAQGRATLQRKECDEALGAGGERDRRAVTCDLEPVQQREPSPDSGFPPRPSALGFRERTHRGGPRRQEPVCAPIRRSPPSNQPMLPTF